MFEVRYNDVVQRLIENHVRFFELTLQDHARLLIIQHGGHVLGPFLGDGNSMTWLNAAFLEKNNYKYLLASHSGWLQGGARTLIAPEIQYNVKDRTHFFDSYFLPAQVNPGHYEFEKISSIRYRISQDMELDLFNLATGTKRLNIMKEITPADNPLRELSSCSKLMDGVTYCGYEITFILSEQVHDGVQSEIWDLTQLKSGGELFICASPMVEYTHYYDPIDENYHRIFDNHARLRLTGDKMYKIGYKSAHLTGKIGYLNRMADNRYSLFIRNFFNNPSAAYAEEPYHTTGLRGHSLHIYNDDGNYGDFGEIECNGQTIGGIHEVDKSTDRQTTWIYIGSLEKLRTIALHLLGIDLSVSFDDCS